MQGIAFLKRVCYNLKKAVLYTVEKSAAKAAKGGIYH